MRFLRSTSLALLTLLSLPAFALSPTGQERLQHLQNRWVEVNYEVPEKQREAAFADLAKEADEAVASEKAAELLIWRGIIQSCWAGAKGGLGALDLVKQAKDSLEQAIALDPKALEGSAYTSLGSLYYQVPMWPLSFGDDDKAEALLKQALEINPRGIDPNYFYGDFLMQDKRYIEARIALEKALIAPPRPKRASADSHRREEVKKLLSQFPK
jgi:tetratricopeptide (TPR) repeat protein